MVICGSQIVKIEHSLADLFRPVHPFVKKGMQPGEKPVRSEMDRKR